MTSYREQIECALRAVVVTSPTSYAWFGSGSRPLPRELRAALPTSAVREYLVEALQRELYRSFYTQGRPMPVGPHRFDPAIADPAFVDALSRANTGAGGWESGWHVEAIERETALVARDGLSVRAHVSDCRAASGPPATGEPVSLRRPKELGSGPHGFYTVLGDVERARSREDVELRVYFHLIAVGAVPLVAVCTRLLNGAKVSFDLKLVDRPTGYARCDAAVLYLEDGSFDRVRRWLAMIASACAPYLRRDPPAFAKPIARGVAVGEHDARLGASFGSGRCRLLAEGIVVAHENGCTRLDDRVDAVARRFTEVGLDIEAPYLAPGSAHRYAL
jgi:hypothetical protein